jgi:hypothetical protein
VSVADQVISLFGQLHKLTFPLFAAPLDWDQLPACQILMMSKWNDLFDLVLDFVLADSKKAVTRTKITECCIFN